MATAMSWISLDSSTTPAVHLPGVQNLPPQRHDGLRLAVPGLLGAPPGGISLHQKELGQGRVLPHAVGQFPRQGRPAQDLLPDHLLGRP